MPGPQRQLLHRAVAAVLPQKQLEGGGLRRDEHQALHAGAGDVLQHILRVTLLQNGLQRLGGVAVHRQIPVALGAAVAHHQLAALVVLQGRSGGTLHLRGQALHLLGDGPAVVVLFQNGQVGVLSLAAGIQHRRILPAIAVPITEQEGRRFFPADGVFQLGRFAQIGVQGLLHLAVPAGELGRAQQLFHRRAGARARAAPAQQQKQAQTQCQPPFHANPPSARSRRIGETGFAGFALT